MNRRTALTRFLSRDELWRLHRALDQHSRTGTRRARQADIIRLLLLTGCRRGEILALRWNEVDGTPSPLAIPRPARGTCISMPQPVASSSVSPVGRARSCFRLCAIPSARMIVISRYGIVFAPKLELKTCACTTFATRWQVTPL